MPELTPIKMSAMNEALQLAIGDLFYLGQEDETSDTGYYSRRITAQTVATGVLSSLSLPLLFTKTTAKNAAGAINEIAPTKITGTLLAGSTSITLSDAAITANSTLKFYSDKWGLVPSAAPVVAVGSVTLTFDAQESDTVIKVEVYS